MVGGGGSGVGALDANIIIMCLPPFSFCMTLKGNEYKTNGAITLGSVSEDGVGNM